MKPEAVNEEKLQVVENNYPWPQYELTHDPNMNTDSGGDGILAISNPKRWCCESTTFNMPGNLENSAVATGLEKVSFHSNPKERQCQRMLKLPHNCTSHMLVK